MYLDKMKRTIFVKVFKIIDMRKVVLIFFIVLHFTSYSQQKVDTEVLDSELNELIIEIEKIDSKWVRRFKRPKVSDWAESPIILPDSHLLLCKYTPKQALEFNGVSFLVIAPAMENIIDRKFKPIIYKLSEKGDTISLIGNEYLQTNQIKNRLSIFERRKGSQLAFEFNYTIEIAAGETFYIGFEMIRNELTPENYHDVVWVAPLRSKNHPESKSFITKGESFHPTASLVNIDEEVKSAYFELKVVK